MRGRLAFTVIALSRRSKPDPALGDRHHRLRSAGNAKDLEDGGEMNFYRPLGKAEQAGDLAIGLAAGHESQNFRLALREAKIRRLGVAANRRIR